MVASLSCTAALVASSVACSSGDDASTLPSNTSGSTPSTTSLPVTTPPTATGTASPATGSGPVALDAQSTYLFGGLQVTVNLPAAIPAASRPNMRLLSDFFQADGRTIALSKLDPSLSGLASADVVRDTKASISKGSVKGIGSVTYTISAVRTVAGGTTLATGCLDQSKIVHLRKDGSQFVDVGARTQPTIKMTASISRELARPKVTLFTFADGPC